MRLKLALPRRLPKPASNRIDRYDCEYQQQSDHNYWNADEIQCGGIGETSIDLLVEPADDFEACSLELMRNRLIRAGFAYRTPPNGSRSCSWTFQSSSPSTGAKRAAPPKPRGGRAALAGGGASREGSVSVGQCIALLEAEVERKLTSALIIFLACPRFESSDPP